MGFGHATALPYLIWGMGGGWVVRGRLRGCLRSGVNANAAIRSPERHCKQVTCANQRLRLSEGRLQRSVEDVVWGFSGEDTLGPAFQCGQQLERALGEGAGVELEDWTRMDTDRYRTKRLIWALAECSSISSACS